MKTIVYFEDGSIEATVRADELVASGIARYATPAEVRVVRALLGPRNPRSAERKRRS